MSNLKEITSTTNGNGIIDLECGGSGVEIDDDSDAKKVSSCYPQFYSTHEHEEEVEEIERLSDCSIIIDVVTLVPPYSINNDNINKRDCRICHLSLVGDDDDDAAIELGCYCKNDLAAAHKHCALTWFKIKGNKICEICNSTASNLVVPDEMQVVHGTTDVNQVVTSTHMSSVGRAGARRGERQLGCINVHRLLNFILACLVFSFVISWLFHFNIPS